MIRILPRDLFNDANLLKCLGKLILSIEDNKIPGLTYKYDDNPFNICQSVADGSTYVNNIVFFDKEGMFIKHFRPLNSRENYPLVLYYGESDYYPFDENGEYELDKKLFLPKLKLVK